MSASDRSPIGDPSADPSADPSRDSDSALPRTYGRTDGDEVVTTRDTGRVSNARASENHAIGPLVLGRSLRFAEQNGAKVIAAVDLPESVLVAFAALVDAVSQEFSALDEHHEAVEVERERKNRPMCRRHLGQYADFCSPCRSEEIGAE